MSVAAVTGGGSVTRAIEAGAAAATAGEGVAEAATEGEAVAEVNAVEAAEVGPPAAEAEAWEARELAHHPPQLPCAQHRGMSFDQLACLIPPLTNTNRSRGGREATRTILRICPPAACG
jgi:hypothetical protein